MSRFIVSTLILLSSIAQVHAMPQTLRKVVDEAASASSYGVPFVVVSDLDETLIDSTARRYHAMRAATNELCGAQYRAGDCGRIAGINLAEMLALPNRYDHNPLYDAVGVAKGDWRKAHMDKSVEAYLSGRFMELDQAVPGATELVQALKGAGATVFFVSSRYDDRQREGTLRDLRELGMIGPGEASTVILRARGQSSIDFKKQSFARIQEWARASGGYVGLVLENEPENMNAMSTTFRGATSVFVEGAWLKPEKLSPAPDLVLNHFR